MVFSFLDPFYAAGKHYTELGLFFLSQPVARKHVKRHSYLLNQRLFYIDIAYKGYTRPTQERISSKDTPVYAQNGRVHGRV
jgi:hypothetical protein